MLEGGKDREGQIESGAKQRETRITRSSREMRGVLEGGKDREGQIESRERQRETENKKIEGDERSVERRPRWKGTDREQSETERDRENKKIEGNERSVGRRQRRGRFNISPYFCTTNSVFSFSFLFFSPKMSRHHRWTEKYCALKGVPRAALWCVVVVFLSTYPGLLVCAERLPAPKFQVCHLFAVLPRNALFTLRLRGGSSSGEDKEEAKALGKKGKKEKKQKRGEAHSCEGGPQDFKEGKVTKKDKTSRSNVDYCTSCGVPPEYCSFVACPSLAKASTAQGVFVCVSVFFCFLKCQNP